MAVEVHSSPKASASGRAIVGFLYIILHNCCWMVHKHPVVVRPVRDKGGKMLNVSKRKRVRCQCVGIKTNNCTLPQ